MSAADYGHSVGRPSHHNMLGYVRFCSFISHAILKNLTCQSHNYYKTSKTLFVNGFGNNNFVLFVVACILYNYVLISEAFRREKTCTVRALLLLKSRGLSKIDNHRIVFCHF